MIGHGLPEAALAVEMNTILFELEDRTGPDNMFAITFRYDDFNRLITGLLPAVSAQTIKSIITNATVITS
jgi:hypothetical protein